MAIGITLSRLNSTSPVRIIHARALSVFADAATPLLLLDYDGTLAPFRLDRFLARPWAGVREVLTRIERQERTRLVVITGRPAHEIAPLLGIDPPLEDWGLHGVERLLPDGRRELEQASAYYLLSACVLLMKAATRSWSCLRLSSRT
jgi:trehalose-6-phosphatase